ncbi:hypothetical protein [uncultured Bacteroides sp.]|uniref:hypothetical protein n=1 Tax=uncultured Bacteroides sp. TaxID=162156 RepID=UPI0025EEA861|nr:hypothetical protein [uncultured Bacteroides sp.]
MTNNQLIEEIVTKECERYALEDSGFVTDKRAAVKELSCGNNAFLPDGCSLVEFREWKEHLLSNWYSRRGFAKFFRRKAEKHCMFRMVRRLSQNALSAIQRRQTEATIDEELKMENGRTVAFRLSSDLFMKFYQEMCCNGTLFASPGELEKSCINGVCSLFPLKYTLLYERLLVKDNEFWEEIWRLIHRFIRFLVVEKNKEDEEAVKEVSMETVISVQEQLERGKLAQVESARHLLNSLQMTGRNKFREWLRTEKKRQEEILLEDEDWQYLECQDSVVPGSEKIDGRFAYLLEVNEKNEYDVCCALADILSYGHGRVYDELVEGMQDVAQAISMLYVENKKYEEIAWTLYGASDGRKLDNLRKSVSRGKEYLKKRTVSLIIEYKHKGYVPFVVGEEVVK